MQGPKNFYSTGYDMLAVSGSPHVVGFTIDTLNNPEDGHGIIDAWASGEIDVSLGIFREFKKSLALNPVIFLIKDIASPHSLAISGDGDTVYLAEVAEKSKPFKLHKFEVVKKQSQSAL